MTDSCLSPETLLALKREIASSLHCALPGFVESFDPEAGTAVIRPAVKRKRSAQTDEEALPLPLLRDVPVYLPAPREIAPGEGCLVVFADCEIDGWFESGEVSLPGSDRQHSLSDGFAFVGFTSHGRQ